MYRTRPPLYLAVVFGLIVGIQANAFAADDVVCPKFIAAVENNVLSQRVKGMVRDLYREIGCKTAFENLPAKRALLHFNKGLVDGEVFRLRAVEKLYTRPFVRTQEPLWVVTNSLWLHPDLKDSDRYPIGYLAGIVWQEEYMKVQNANGRYFNGVQDLFEAYNKGQLKGFLSADDAVKTSMQAGVFGRPPERAEVLREDPVYHYVGAEYAPFLDVFSEKLKRHPFKGMGVKDAR